MLSDLPITRVQRSRIGEVDFDNLRFGYIFSDHMFAMDYADGRWQHPRIEPYGPIALEPGSAMMHYGQTVFDGFKAYRGADGIARVFRPDANARRLQSSCRRLCMPEVDEALFAEAVRQLVALDHAWLPPKDGQSLYVRPLMIGTEVHLDVRPDKAFRFMIITAPVGAYFDPTSKGVSLKAEDAYTRAASIGGLGYAKTGANYAASMFATEQARSEGFDQVLWLDSNEHRYVEEVGAMNIFFKRSGAVITPPLGGSILPGVTRDSLITLMREQGLTVEERRIAIDEVMDAIRDGSMEEIFGAGTAAVVSPVARLSYRGETLELKQSPGPLTRSLYDRLTGIQTGRLPDPHGWCVQVPLPAADAPAAPIAAPAR
ncbi:MAG TPA: branched-chain amino acid aminotransferase [bacterium]|nr:branched-chain amino acid aminotransferase [bacterium]